MRLHTAKNFPDWYGVADSDRNIWQRMAARTGGVITPANFVSAAGLVVVIFGIYLLSLNRYSAGVLVIAAGRALDVVDGWLADTTGTKSPLGEAVDATIDKIATLGTLLILALIGLMPAVAVVLLAVPQVTATIVTLYMTRLGREVHPSRVGKLGMAASWLSLLCFLALHVWPPGRQLTVMAYALLVGGLVLAFAAIEGYRKGAK